MHAVLARFEAPWLLIFDNADTASVAAFLPPAGPGRVLITSQDPAWPGLVLDVPVLDPDVAAGFLVSRSDGQDRQAARELASALGGWTGQAGDPVGARDLLAELLPVRERVSGPEHPDTLIARHELDRWIRRADGGPSTA